MRDKYSREELIRKAKVLIEAAKIVKNQKIDINQITMDSLTPASEPRIFDPVSVSDAELRGCTKENQDNIRKKIRNGFKTGNECNICRGYADLIEINCGREIERYSMLKEKKSKNPNSVLDSNLKKARDDALDSVSAVINDGFFHEKYKNRDLSKLAKNKIGERFRRIIQYSDFIIQNFLREKDVYDAICDKILSEFNKKMNKSK